MKNAIRIILLSTLVIGPIAALVLKAFEFIAIEGTVWWWNDLWNSDVERWRVIPLALFGGVVFACTAVILRQKRLPKPAVDPLEEHGSPGKPTIAAMGITLAVGAASLMFAGASLGPEAPLMAFATLLGLWAATQAKLPAQQMQYLVLVSIGALLVAFLGSLVPAVLPLLLLLQQAKLPWSQPARLLEYIRKGWKKAFALTLPVIGAAATSFFVLWLLDPSVEGYGNIPVGAHFGWEDFVLAPLLGAVTLGVGWLLKKATLGIHNVAVIVDKKVPVAVYALFTGAGIGLLYFIGGQSVQFSGSIGTHLLMENAPQLGFAALVGLLVVKLLVTAWSAAVGYRGGLVFPSIFIGVTIALIIGLVFPHAGAGVMIGSVAGIIAAITGGPAAFIMIAAIVPPTAGLWILALLAIAGALITKKLFARLKPTV